MIGRIEHLINTPHLAKRPQVHDPYPVRDMGNHGKIMRNEQMNIELYFPIQTSFSVKFITGCALKFRT